MKKIIKKLGWQRWQLTGEALAILLESLQILTERRVKRGCETLGTFSVKGNGCTLKINTTNQVENV